MSESMLKKQGVMASNDIFNDTIENFNLTTQIDLIVESFIKNVKDKCLENNLECKNLHLDMKVSSYVPTFDIPCEKVDGHIKVEVIEKFEFDSSEEMTIKDRKISYRDERSLSDSLKTGGFVREVMECVMADSDFTKDDFDKDLKDQSIISEEFIKWINDTSKLKELIKNKWSKYEDSFKNFTIDSLVDQLSQMLKHVFIRRVRSRNVTNYIDENYSKYLRFFNNHISEYTKKIYFDKEEIDKNRFNKDELIKIKQSCDIREIKAKVAAVVNWFENKSKDFYKKAIYKEYPNIDSTYFESFGTNQNIIVVYIVCHYLNPVTHKIEHSGTTIKVASNNDLMTEIIKIQGSTFSDNKGKIDFSKMMMEENEEMIRIYTEIRKHFFNILVGENYLIKGRDTITEIYKEFYKRTQERIKKIYI